MTFEDTLATWLVKQRWFAGKGRTVHDLAVVADTEIIPGDPGLRHLMVTVSHGATSDCYQLFIGYRARLPARLRHARIGTNDGLQIYDGLHDSALTRTLLDAIVDDRSVGILRFCRVPGAEIQAGLDSLVLTGEQSNTSLVFGESAIFKVFRRVSPGPNPDLEVASALAQLGSSHIAEPFGWVETRIDGATTVLAILSRYLRAASDGWSLAATSVRDLYATEEGTRAAEAERAKDAAQDAEGELADREPGEAHLGRVEGRPVRGGHRGPALMDHDQDGQADHAGCEDKQSPPCGADATQLQPLHPGHRAEAVATARGPGRAAGQCGGGHDRLPW